MRACRSHFARLNLPPVAVQILTDANDLDDLLKVAVQLRNDYRKLREWLGEFQSALDAKDVKEVLSRKKLLQSVAKHVDTLAVPSSFGDATIQIGVDWPLATPEVGPTLKVGLTFKVGNGVNAIRNRYGVRAQIHKLILEQPGQHSLKRLLKMLGEENTTLGLALEREFLQRSSVGSTLDS